jgi:hypothetical protein
MSLKLKVLIQFFSDLFSLQKQNRYQKRINNFTIFFDYTKS